MPFRITGLDPAPFQSLFGLSETALARCGVRRIVADAFPGYPDGIEIRDARPGETLLLLNHAHQPAENPYHGRHAIFVRDGALRRYDRVGEIPPAMRSRMISLRGFDTVHEMLLGELAEGASLEPAIIAMLADTRVSYVQAHYARRGCYAARIERA